MRPKYAPAEAEDHIVKTTNPFLLQESDMRIRAQSPRNKAAVPFEDIIGNLQEHEDSIRFVLCFCWILSYSFAVLFSCLLNIRSWTSIALKAQSI